MRTYVVGANLAVVLFWKERFFDKAFIFLLYSLQIHEVSTIFGLKMFQTMYNSNFACCISSSEVNILAYNLMTLLYGMIAQARN